MTTHFSIGVIVFHFAVFVYLGHNYQYGNDETGKNMRQTTNYEITLEVIYYIDYAAD